MEPLHPRLIIFGQHLRKIQKLKLSPSGFPEKLIRKSISKDIGHLKCPGKFSKVLKSIGMFQAQVRTTMSNGIQLERQANHTH